MANRLLYSWVLGWSFLSLLLERLWNSFWPAVTTILFFVAASLMNLHNLFGNTAHIAFLTVFFCALALSLRFGHKFVFPRRTEIERHIEEESQLPHRPLETLRDKPAPGTDNAALALWQKHIAMTVARYNRLRVYRPRTDSARQDRFALRHAAMLLLFMGLVISGHDAPSRLIGALQPKVTIDMGAPARVEAWIAPPEYTRQPAQILKADMTEAVTAPAGSVLKLRVSGTSFTPKLTYSGAKEKLAETGQESYVLEKKLQESGTLKVSYFLRSLASWEVKITPDQTPDIAIEATTATAAASTKITYRASDDYGITKITGEIAAKDSPDKIIFDIPLPASAGNGLIHTEDLSRHKFAGTLVTLTLIAEDGGGNKTVSAPESLLLPQRQFKNPVAAKLIEERQRLIMFDGWLTQRIAGRNIIEIANRPVLYKGDPMIFLGLAVAAKRIALDGDEESIASVIKLLWDIALRIEDGGLSQASRELSDALQKLQQKLADKTASKAEVDQLVAEVQKKLREYFQTMAMEMQQRMEQGGKSGTISPELARKFMKHIDLNAIIQQMRALTEGESRDQMQKMAEMLKKNIDSMDMNKLDQINKAQEQMMESLEDLQNLIKEQQALLDRTNKKLPDENSHIERAEQSVLREKLGDIVRRMSEVTSEIPENFSKADQSMKEAQAALANNKPKESAPHQKAALDELQKGMDDVVQKIAQGMQEAFSLGFMPDNTGYGEGYDPLGRKGQSTESDVKIPEEKERRRVQEIIKELRNRSNDYQRPKVERDYIDRLLDTFN